MKNKLLRLFVVSLAASTITGCALRSGETDDLARLRDVGSNNGRAFGLSGIRHTALRDASLSVGARGGLASRSAEINQEILTHTDYLNRIFNFYAMLLDNNVVPPVLIEGRNTLEQSDDDTLRISDRQYMIVSQAYFITTAPSWRDYLILDYCVPEIPDRSLLPKNSVEKKVWDRYIDEGWMAGRMQANSIFLENLNKLKQDYNGMILYRTLLAQNMVSAPYVAKQLLGVTGNCNEMAINDRILRITVKPCFQLQSENWKADMVRAKAKLPVIRCETKYIGRGRSPYVIASRARQRPDIPFHKKIKIK